MKRAQMPIHYSCRKCKIDYSKEEFAHSKFCKECGSFLLLSFKKELISSPNQNNSNLSVERRSMQRAAESLNSRITSSREFEVVSQEEKMQPNAPSFESWLWSSEFDEALRLEKSLVKKYKGKTLEEAIPGEVVSNEQGECYAVSASCTSTFKKATYEESRRLIISDLKILPGIGPVREQTLKQQGYHTIEDLKNHPMWKNDACKFIKLIDQKEVD
jgi:predicted flap endonuclease-1-like 5' DNA nuclease